MADLVGKVLSVDSRNDGEPVVTDAAAGDLVLYVLDASTFDENGGTCLIQGYATIYTATDTDLDSLTLASGLGSNVYTDTLVEVYPAAPVRTAMVDLGGEGDAVPATIPQALVELLPMGVRDPLDQETVTVAERGLELVVADVVGRPLPTGTVDPSRVAVGIVGNLVQDPGFLTDYWKPATDPFSVLGPDYTYTDINYVSSVGTPDTTQASQFYLTDRFPVEVGQNVRISAQSRPSADSPTSSTTTPASTGQTRCRVRVEFFKADQTRLSGADQYQDFLIPDDDPTGVWSQIQGTFPVPEGYVQARAYLESVFQIQGTLDYCKPSVTVPWNRVASTNYDPGNAGWAFDDDSSQVQSLNVLEALGATDAAFSTLSVGGSDLVGDLLGPMPLGVVAYDIDTTGTNSGTGTTVGTEYRMYEFAMGSSLAGRLYRIVAEGHLMFGAANDAVDIRIRATYDGSAPTVTSALFRTERYTPGSTTTSRAFRIEKPFAPGAYDNVRFLVTMTLVAGTSATIYGTGSDRAFLVYVEDTGLYASAAVAGTLSKISVASGTAQPTPVNAYQKTFKPYVTETYEGGGSKRLTSAGSRSAGMYQGNWGDGHGNQKSVALFDYAAIQSALTGATITKVTVTYRVKYGKGGSVFNPTWGTHTLASVPSTLTSSSYTANRARTTGRNEGSTYTDTLPVAVGNELKAGTAKGLLLGPWTGTGIATADTGGVNGYDDGAAPYLTIYYSK